MNRTRPRLFTRHIAYIQPEPTHSRWVALNYLLCLAIGFVLGLILTLKLL